MTYDNNDGPIYSMLTGKPCGTFTFECNYDPGNDPWAQYLWGAPIDSTGCGTNYYDCPNGWSGGWNGVNGFPDPSLCNSSVPSRNVYDDNQGSTPPSSWVIVNLYCNP